MTAPTRAAVDQLFDSPEELIVVLRYIAELSYDSASELGSAWQDRGVERLWTRIGKIVDRAAASIEALV